MGAVSFPLECVGEDGKALNADSFIAGYTQVYVFPDGRTNENPPVQGLTLNGEVIEEDPDSAPVVARCANAPAAGEGQSGCGREEAAGCKTHKIQAIVDDVAEPDPEAAVAGAGAVREAIWVDYYTDGGSLTGAKKLISDTAKGYREKHETEWTPPAEAGLVTLWAVVHDARAGASVTRRFVRVE
jgi:hypothetical protein